MTFHNCSLVITLCYRPRHYV